MVIFNLFKRKIPPQKWVDLIYEEGTQAKNVKIKDLKKATEFRVENCNRIMEDCLRIMRDTKNPDTFFTRYKLFDDQLYFLTCLEPYCKFKSKSPSELREQAINVRENTIEPFLRVRFNELFNIVHGSYTEKVKLNRVKKYMSMLETYKPQIPNNVFSTYNYKCKKLIDELAIKMR